jgi:hypothetical protein
MYGTLWVVRRAAVHMLFPRHPKVRALITDEDHKTGPRRIWTVPDAMIIRLT